MLLYLVCCVEIKQGYNFKCSLDAELHITELILRVMNVFLGRICLVLLSAGNFLSVETALVFLAFQLLQGLTVSYRVAQLWLLNGVHTHI